MTDPLSTTWGQVLARWKEQTQNTPHLRSIALADDRLKAKLIGREGRNIAAFEQSTGCDLLVDLSPSQAGIVSFSPDRRLAAELTLTNLLLEDRIHPDRIIDVADECSVAPQSPALLRALGREAATIVQAHPLEAEEYQEIGRLFARSESGQPLLTSAIEAALLARSLLEALDHSGGEAASLALLAQVAEDRLPAGPHTEALQSIRTENPNSLTTAAVCAALDASRSRLGARRTGIPDYEALPRQLRTLPQIHKAWLMRRGQEVWLLPADSALTDAEAESLVESARRSCEYPHSVKTRVVRQPD